MLPSREKAVSFSPLIQIRKSNNSSSADPRSTWYSSSDYKRFRIDRAMDVYRIQCLSVNDLMEKECGYGVENLIVPGMRERAKETRIRAVNDVLGEQKEQLKQCRFNPDDISRASTAHSRQSALIARKKALFYTNLQQSQTM